MQNIIEISESFDFTNLSLGIPNLISGDAYFTRLFYNSKPLFIQTEKSLTKQGFIKLNKKSFCDLMFNVTDNTLFINWIEQFEEKCHNLIYNKSETWFKDKLEKNDIETYFTSPIKSYKSGKFYLLRTNLKQNIKIYNENNDILSYENVNANTCIISILEIQGIKFTSRSFQIEIEMKQAMIVSPDPFLDTCFIKNPNKKNINEEFFEEKENQLSIEPVQPNENNQEKIDLNDTNQIKQLEEILNDFDEKKKRIKENETSDIVDINEMTTNNINLQNNTTQKIKFASDVVDNSDKISKYKYDFQEDDEENNLLTIFDDKDVPKLEFEDLNKPIEPSNQNNKDLTEVNIDSIYNNPNMFVLKKANEVYYKLYKEARKKAKEAKKNAIQAFMEAKKIKKTYLLNDSDDSDSENGEDGILL
jgi:hypothetical protein